MAVDRTRYRQLDFIGARILQSRELNWLQEIDQGVAVGDNETTVSGELQVQFRQGALYNVTISTTGLVVTLSPKDGVNPMMIFVRDRWEIFPSNNDDVTDTTGTYPGNHTVTLSSANTVVYLNWELRIRVGGLTGDDPVLTDAITNEAVASAGELILHISNADTSTAPLAGNQLAKNVAPVSLANFTNSGSVLTLVPTDNVIPQALASSTVSGFVKCTTNTPVVVSTDDPRMTNARPAADGSVHDATVRTPVSPGGTNSDGTPVYNLSSDIGGINAAKIIYVTGTQRVSDFLTWIKTQFNNLLSRYNAHETAPLGRLNTHPFPTAAQVGAAPASHVGQVLGLPTSHPPVVNQNSGGFQVNRSAGGGAVDDPAYGVFVTGTPIVSMNHDGDISSNAAAAFTAVPMSPLASGPLKHMSLIARVLTEHVNQISHANPHGLTAADIGAATVAYVDAGDAAAIATAEAYTDATTAIVLRASTHRTGTTWIQDSAVSLIPWPQTQTYINYSIFKFGLHFEFAIGSGAVHNTEAVPLPEASNWTSTHAIILPSMQWERYHYDQDVAAATGCYYTLATNTVHCYEQASGHTGNFNNWANVIAIFWRFF